MERTAYCENEECRVVLYAVPDRGSVEQDDTNCPGCGRFGRLKNLGKED